MEAILNELNPVYAPQQQAIQGQIAQLPAYYQQQQAGLETAKVNAFGDITNQANARGMVYSGAPIHEQNRYVGEKYLPAVAGLKQQQNERQFQLTSSLNDINAKRYGQAFDMRQRQQEMDAQRALEQQKLAMAARGRASGGGRGGGGGKAKSQAIDWNARSVQDWLHWTTQNFKTNNWGEIARAIEEEAGQKIKTGSNLDQALHYRFTGIY